MHLSTVARNLSLVSFVIGCSSTTMTSSDRAENSAGGAARPAGVGGLAGSGGRGISSTTGGATLSQGGVDASAGASSAIAGATFDSNSAGHPSGGAPPATAVLPAAGASQSGSANSASARGGAATAGAPSGAGGTLSVGGATGAASGGGSAGTTASRGGASVAAGGGAQNGGSSNGGAKSGGAANGGTQTSITASGGSPRGGTSGSGGSSSSAPTGPTITTTSLAQGIYGSAYSATLTATTTGNATWSISSGALPSGLTLSTSGNISGTPTADGAFTFVVAVLDGSGLQKTAVLNLTVIAVPVSVSAGTQHTCVLMNNGKVKCWGSNDWGQLGNDSTDASISPVDVKGMVTAAAISVGGSLSCARLSGGTVSCWGMNVTGALGNGSDPMVSDRSKTPVQVSNLSSVVDVSTDGGSTCAVTAAGAVSCWGSKATTGSNQTNLTPVTVSGFDSTVTRVAGGYTGCAILGSNGAVQCWGGNYYGMLGNDTNDNSTTPVYVQGLGVAAKQIAVGTRHVCAALNGADVACWGNNYNDELGVSSNVVAHSYTARGVAGVTGVAAVAVGDDVTCVLNSGGSVRCWGDNTCGGGSSATPCGMLGNLTSTKSSSPSTVWPGTNPAKSIALGGAHGCLVAQDNAVYCWGANGVGQLGRDPTAVGYSEIPLKVAGI